MKAEIAVRPTRAPAPMVMLPQMLRAHPMGLTSARRAAQDTTKPATTNVWQKYVHVPMVILPQVRRARQMVLLSVLLAMQGISRMEITVRLALVPHINL